jgi:hypothetical protein
MKSSEGQIKPEFRESLREHKVSEHLRLNDWMVIKKIEKNNGESYFFSERAGIDSVAFILFDANNDTPYGIIEQYRGNYGTFHKGCYTGSNDKPELTLEEIVVEEVLEEAGFEVTLERVTLITKEYCGSGTNEAVHIYIVDVTDLIQGETQPESIFEENTENLWVDEVTLLHCDDWKCKLAHFLLKYPRG